MEDNFSRYWNKFWRDRKGHIVIWQTPNPFLIGWVILTILSLITSGNLSDIFYWAGAVALIIWSVLEIISGANYFRRSLGLVVLILAIVSAINSLK